MQAFTVTNKSGSVALTVWALNNWDAVDVARELTKSTSSHFIPRQMNGHGNKFMISAPEFRETRASSIRSAGAYI